MLLSLRCTLGCCYTNCATTRLLPFTPSGNFDDPMAFWPTPRFYFTSLFRGLFSVSFSGSLCLSPTTSPEWENIKKILSITLLHHMKTHIDHRHERNLPGFVFKLEVMHKYLKFYYFSWIIRVQNPPGKQQPDKLLLQTAIISVSLFHTPVFALFDLFSCLVWKPHFCTSKIMTLMTMIDRNFEK